MLLYNVRVFDNEDAEYVLIRKGRIEKIGKGNLPDAARKINLHDSWLLPGFCDSHTHLSNIALMHSELDLTNLSREAVLSLVARSCNRKIVLGRGWDESFWRNKKYLEREELDNACPDRPVVLIREDGHLASINTMAERQFGVESEEGIVREGQLEKLLRKLDIGKTLDFDYAQDYALSKGVTCVHDFANGDTLRRYMAMHAEGRLKIRIYANFYESSYRHLRSLGIQSGFGDEHLRIGAFKLFADGSIGAKTAATRYVDGEEVKPMLSVRKLKKFVEEANRNGIRVFTHAIGNYAIENVIRAYGGKKMNRIEHFELAYEDFISMLAGEVSMQPNFLKWAKKGGLYEKMLGEQWLKINNPYRIILNYGKTLLFGSDCMPMDPLFGIRLAVESEYDAQKISLKDAVIAYTRGSRYFGPQFGEIREGYVADLVVLDGEFDKMREMRIKMTLVGGRIMYTSQ